MRKFMLLRSTGSLSVRICPPRAYGSRRLCARSAPIRKRWWSTRPDTLAAVRVLVVTNLTPDAEAPARGSFVRDQVEAIRRAGVEVELLSFPVGASQYPRAVPAIRRALRHGSFDLVHAHYGLAGLSAAAAGASPLIV